MKRYFLLLLVSLINIGIFAANTEIDTLVTCDLNPARLKNDHQFETVSIGLPLLISGISLKHYDNVMSEMQSSFAAHHSAKVDDYLRFVPGALMYGLKLCGVESESSWKKMIVADAFSAAMMVGSVELLKRTTDCRRPDGTDFRSFPSGHSAMAFMMATMLHKEYGKVSPLYSIGGYAVATYTSISRIINNRHWTSDVLCGAGIGILSTEIGYYLSELIFKENNRNDKIDNIKRQFSRFKFGLNFGLLLANTSYHLGGGEKISLGNGSQSGFAASYQLNKYFSLEGQANYNLLPLKLGNEYMNKYIQDLNVLLGASGHYHFNNGIGVGGRLLGGYNYFLKTKLNDLNLGEKSDFMFESGLFLNLKPYDFMEMQIYVDYNLTGAISDSCKGNTHYFGIGTSAIFNF